MLDKTQVYRLYSNIYLYNTADDVPEGANIAKHIYPISEKIEQLLVKILESCTLAKLDDDAVRYVISELQHNNIKGDYIISDEYVMGVIAKNRLIIDEVDSMELIELRLNASRIQQKGSRESYTIKDIYILQKEKETREELNQEMEKQKEEESQDNFTYYVQYMMSLHDNTFYDCVSKKWYRWNQKHYIMCDKESIEKLVWDEVNNGRLDVERKKITGTLAMGKLVDEWRLSTMEEITEDYLQKKRELREWKLNCENGIVDLVTGELEPHNAKYFFTGVSNVRYDSKATCKTWEKFVEDICEKDIVEVSDDGTETKKGRYIEQEKIRAFQIASGYLLTGSVRAQKAFMFNGVPGAGKGTFVRTLVDLMGSTLSSAVSLENLSKNQHAGFSIYGKRFNVCEEVYSNFLRDDQIKQVISGDKIEARALYMNPFWYYPECKILINCNELPRMENADYSIRRRFSILSFTNIFTDTVRQDTYLKEKLAKETSGILNWCIKGVQMFASDNYRYIESEEIRIATDNWLIESNHILSYFDQSFEKCKDYRIYINDLYDGYETYLQNVRKVNTQKFRKNLANFSRELRSLGFDVRARSTHSRDDRAKGAYVIGWRPIEGYDLLETSKIKF